MGMADTVTKQYMRENEVFADAFNFLLYNGETVIRPEKLKELDTTEPAIPFAINDKGKQQAQAVQKYRDILKTATVMTDDTAAYVLLGIESQTEIHYAMPVRNIIYDALQYGNKLIPVITLVIHFGADKWDAPMSLHEMLAITDEKLLQHIPDYRIKLIDPAEIKSNEMDKFQTSLREVLFYIKYSKDADKLAEYMTDNERMKHLEVNAAQVIKEVTNTKFQIPKEMEAVNMCEAIEELMARRENKGIEQGRQQGMKHGIASGRLSMLRDLVNDGMLTVEEAAAKAGMSVDEFEEKIENL